MRRILTVVRVLASLPIRIYRLIISPLLPPSCIYYPTCSEYSVKAIMQHGIIKGTLLSAGRITRCVGALFEGGEDRVPEQFSFSEIRVNYRRFRRRKPVDGDD